MKDFFVSYNKADVRWAEWISWKLEDVGYQVVVQAWDFRPGGNFVLDMQSAMTETKHTIAVLSEDYLKAAYTQPEWASALGRDPTGEKRILLPIRVRKCKPEGLLAERIYIDLVGLSEEEATTQLIDALNDRGKPEQSPSFPGGKVSSKENNRIQVKTFPGKGSSAVAIWQEKLDYLREQEAIVSDPSQKFSIRKLIQEAEGKLEGQSENPR